MIQIQNVSKRYGDKYAVKNATFEIHKGEILGFLGRNGAGKTTTMNIITGYISSTEGRVLLDGHDILEDPRYVKRHIGYLPEQPPLYMDMTVQEYLKFVSQIKDVNARLQNAHIDDIVDLVRIGDVRKRLIKNLSKGYKQRVGLAQALIGNPDTIILDEPTVGLDPKQIIEIRRLIKDLGEDHTVVLSSHILGEVADVCERLVIINKGEIVAQDTLDNLTRGLDESGSMTIRVAGPEKSVQRVLRSVQGIRFVDSLGVKEEDSVDFVIESDNQHDVRRPLFNALARQGFPILMLRPMNRTLEDVFLKLTKDEGERI